MTSESWTQDITDDNIKYALFGNWIAWSTPYTRLRDDSCVPTTVSTLSSSYPGWTLPANTIYILNSGDYTLSYPITMYWCSALIGNGNVVIKSSSDGILDISNAENVIIDAIKFDGNDVTTWIVLSGNNITFNNIDLYNNDEYGISSRGNNFHVSNSRFYNNDISLSVLNGFINNSLFYNSTWWILLYFSTIHINNSQFFNHSYAGITSYASQNLTIHNSAIYNNTNWILSYWSKFQSNNTAMYNNGTWIHIKSFGGNYSYFTWYGTLQLFGNTVDTSVESWSSFELGTSSSLWRANGQLETWSVAMSYNRVTNPQNGSGEYLLSGTSRTSLRGTQSFDPDVKPLRYIFWGNILKQVVPVRYNGSSLEEYGSDGMDYDETKYIAEPESSLAVEQQEVVNDYFSSDSLYTENRETNWCSLSAFEIVELDPGIFYNTYHFQDHTIYILTWGEYKFYPVTAMNYGFEFDGNCIALLGNEDTRFVKYMSQYSASSFFYANNKNNIIIDTIKINWSSSSSIGINFAGASNNNTIANVQTYNNTQHGISLGQSSHHNTITDSQIINNLTGGIYITYDSNYNIVNNTQIYNNGLYGIWFANGSKKNTINNSQIYNNAVGIFGDWTTQNNVINKTTIYNNSTAGILFKNSSNNILNDVRIYNNEKGIQTLYNSVNNIFYGDLYLFDNGNNFDGTTADDGYLTSSDGWDFAYGGTLTTGSSIMWCTYVTNPSISGSTTSLLNSTCSNTGRNTLFTVSSVWISYMYGLNMYKQSIPVKYESGSSELVELPASYYDVTKYIGEISAVWDDVAENISFGNTSSVEPNVRYTSNVYTAGTMNTTVDIQLILNPSSTSGSLLINGINVGSGSTISNGDTVQLYVFTPAGYGETVTWTLTIWSVTTGIVITTRQRSQLPSTWSFDFTSFTSLPVDTFTGSTTTISGIETGVLASITFTPSTTSGRIEIYSGTDMLYRWTAGLLVHSGNQVKVVAQSSSTYAQTITGNIIIGQGTWVFTLTTKWADSVPPTTPTLTYPLSGEELFFVTFNRNASTDTGSGIQWYAYEIAEDNAFLDIIDDGFMSTVTGTSGTPDTDFDVTSDTYYVRIRAKDRDDNYSTRSNIWTFEARELNDRKFSEKTGANLRTYYESDEITLAGIKPGVSLWASVSDDGILYKNWVEKWTWTYVQNDDDLYILLRSSSRYDRTVSSTLTLANRSVEFIITTKEEWDACNLSSGDRETIETIFTSLIENYSGDESRYNEFLYTIQSMLADEIDFTNDCNLQYLENLINGELWITTTGYTNTTINTWIHIAPNCKQYTVNYDSTRMGYTSSGFKVATYFANRDTLGRYIDSKNPGECHLTSYAVTSWMFTNTNPSRHIASNGKIYLVQSDSNWYYSNDFVVKKYFSTLVALRNYIDSKNLPQQVRSHTVDTSFTPQSYIAPNAKEYTIYRTNRWYMSYKLLTVRYFNSLSDIQNFIRVNNLK